MAMTRPEMEHNRQEYYARVAIARSAQQDENFPKAVEFAILSWPHIDGMMQYERKYEEQTFVSIEGIDIFLTYGPVLFDSVNLDALAALLKSQRRIEKNTSADLGAALSDARGLMWDAHRLWEFCERNPGSRQDEVGRILGGEQTRWQWIADHWEKMGLIRRTGDGSHVQIEFCTRMDEPTSAKCPSCGAVGKAPKSNLLNDVKCPKCRTRVQFVILASESENRA